MLLQTLFIADFYQSHLSLVSKNLQCRQQDHLRVRRGSALCAFHYPRVGVSSEGIAVVLCVCVLAKSQTLAVAALNSETQGSQGLLCSLEKVVSSRLAGLLLSCEAAKAGKFW